MFTEAILTTYKEKYDLVALCDTNELRSAYHNKIYKEKYGLEPLPTYHVRDFDLMIEREKPDVMIVTSADFSHHEYIIRALKAGCDVITEKPMTIDEVKCQQIIDTVKETGKEVRVSFNYRYAPSRSKVKELILEGAIGQVRSVHFEWLLDTTHGADYFRRWHRDKRNSGGLMVHKATHHFDLVNWWLDSVPETVFGLGSLGFYGKINGMAQGNYYPYLRSTDNPAARDDPFGLDMRENEKLNNLYWKSEHIDGYVRDLNVFGDGISIEDTMNVLVKYRNGAQMSYSLHAYSPWEGYRIAFNGTRGRIELDEMERSYISAGSGHITDGVTQSRQLKVLPHWEKPYEVEVPHGEGGHGGGDPLLLNALFSDKPVTDALGRSATHVDGALSILTGIAANRSFATGQPVKVSDLLKCDFL
ncbi:Gfo/Idh/MocA family oxidoreductase [Ruficoccus sp. ZRK36]|uniref:Gfo/Idh/MocA family protein n=1 Tax=Ruficoccus sp. ZRK36 TaxID=2866311 RepID=UPI001C7326D0|nr:Gfo/Idh/MocA family oxidoreductase [Ruficoccus sp. ZRK36]QYY37241.1 Gfo/Idh/MocA family oxidoreductase [Ruficoccus sp. ZRK36]